MFLHVVRQVVLEKRAICVGCTGYAVDLGHARPLSVYFRLGFPVFPAGYVC